MEKKYTVNPNKKQLKIIKEYWRQLQEDHNDFFELVSLLEENMSTEAGIKDLEFFMCDNEYVGIGNADKSMKLIQYR